jgi:hypothetical protein
MYEHLKHLAAVMVKDAGLINNKILSQKHQLLRYKDCSQSVVIEAHML